MATPKRRPFHEMDHDDELLREEIVYASRTELRGPIPEFLAKKRAEQAPGTAAGYDVVLGVFERFCTEHGIATVGQIVEGVAHDFISAERKRGMSARTIHDRVRRPAHQTGSGSVISPTSVAGKVGCTWRSSSTRTVVKSSAGQWPITCAPSWRRLRCRWR